MKPGTEMIKVKVIAFGIAKDILQTKEHFLSIQKSSSIADLRKSLIDEFPAFKGLSSLQFAVNEDYVQEDYIINEKDEVVLIPPVSGG
ncbi:MAG: molybdopterin synthase sulfur carrier subunit [Cytophagales bacterium CG12_big_fil_rev_8_21_14_0_65_40_12]|nr:MAG: molybdopterin synthase sulfur carrier subunit [Cytophagales bacterium CG12_big_fil_rev_8_21_14_0_65_40_12]PIW02915.1 MAG: molybdopterin synthase sulfur carrier subunit [Cytophagales bacterium CG17_big_fil_post_rev_8_21_14_2_50_40_13]